MASSIESKPGDTWGNTVARWTFIFTMIGALLFIGSVFVWIL
jgi:hypothetical protein